MSSLSSSKEVITLKVLFSGKGALPGRSEITARIPAAADMKKKKKKKKKKRSKIEKRFEKKKKEEEEEEEEKKKIEKIEKI